MNLRMIFGQQFIRFLLVGTINTLFGYGVFVFFIFLGWHYAMAALAGTILGVLFNFQTIGRLVFTSYRHGLIFKFILVYSLTYLLNIFGLYIFNLFGVSNYISGAILIVPMALISYCLNKRFVFIAV